MRRVCGRVETRFRPFHVIDYAKRGHLYRHNARPQSYSDIGPWTGPLQEHGYRADCSYGSLESFERRQKLRRSSEIVD